MIAVVCSGDLDVFFSGSCNGYNALHINDGLGGLTPKPSGSVGHTGVGIVSKDAVFGDIDG